MVADLSQTMGEIMEDNKNSRPGNQVRGSMAGADFPLVIPERARQYLEAQRGGVRSLVGTSEWELEFKKSIVLDFNSITLALAGLPAAARVLDIGSGMGT